MKKYENFKAALKNLKDIYDYEEPYNNVVLTGLAALYEICFEQSWKAMKELLVNEGVSDGDKPQHLVIQHVLEENLSRGEDLFLFLAVILGVIVPPFLYRR